VELTCSQVPTSDMEGRKVDNVLPRRSTSEIIFQRKFRAKAKAASDETQFCGLPYIRRTGSLSLWALAILFASPALADVPGSRSSDHKDHFATKVLRRASYPTFIACVASVMHILAKFASQRYGPREESVYHHVQLFASGIICL
jgi:hypothetical protein